MKCHVESAGTFVPATTAAAPVLACELTKQPAGLTEIQPTTVLGRELKNAQVSWMKISILSLKIRISDALNVFIKSIII